MPFAGYQGDETGVFMEKKLACPGCWLRTKPVKIGRLSIIALIDFG
jgi:hypothetical protein